MTENSKSRFILKKLWRIQTDLNSAGTVPTEGVSDNELIKNITSVFLSKTDGGVRSSARYGWISKELRRCIQDCIKLGYIEKKNEARNLISVSLTGREFIKFTHRFKWIFENWFFKTLKPLVAPLLLLLFIIYVSGGIFALLGYTVESFNILGINIVKIPRFEYSYEPSINAFGIKNNKDRIRIEEISWGVSVGDLSRAQDVGNWADNGIVKVSELKWLLLDELWSKTGNADAFWPERVDQRMKDFLECNVLPTFMDTGIPARVSIYYNFENENETRIMRDLIYFRGIGDISPNIYVEKRNVSQDEAYDFTREGGFMDNVLDSHAQELKKVISDNIPVKDDKGNCNRTITHGYPDW